MFLSRNISIALFLLTTFVSSVFADYAEVTPDGRGAVATVQPIATQAAIQAYKRGGNAVDAALAAAFTLGVVDGHNSGIGGGCFVLIRWADGRIEAIDGREVAPAAAHRDMFVKDGRSQPQLSRTGPLAIGVPGSVAAFEYLSKRGGKLAFSDLLLPAAALAEAGFPIDAIYAKRIAKNAATFKQFPASGAVLLNEDGGAWPVGHVLQQKDLADTYRGIAKSGSDYFYKGEFAARVAAWMKVNGGLITHKDFSGYTLKFREPIHSQFAGYDIYGFSPPSSGGLHVAQILTMLERFDFLPMSTFGRYQVTAEAMKLAFADRAYWLGDSDFVKVPKGLLDQKYLQERAKKIRLDKVLAVGGQGTPPKAELDVFATHTTHIATADKDGNWVAITTTVNTDFGSKVMVPGTGVFLNNQMDDFSATPGVANIYGLVGSEANSIAPGKRPLSSMSPTLVLKDGKPLLTLGAAGGPTIISQVVQALNNHLRLNMPLAEAVAAPRIHQQWRPDILYVEGSVAQADRKALEKIGHKTSTLGPYGSTQAIGIDAKGSFVAVAEPRLLARNNTEPQRAAAGAKVNLDDKRKSATLPEAGYLESRPEQAQ